MRPKFSVSCVPCFGATLNTISHSPFFFFFAFSNFHYPPEGQNGVSSADQILNMALPVSLWKTWYGAVW